MNKYQKIFNRSTRRTGGPSTAYCAARTADCGYCGLRTCGTALVVYVFRVPHSCKVGALLSALFHCHRPVAFTGATHALQAHKMRVQQSSWSHSQS